MMKEGILVAEEESQQLFLLGWMLALFKLI